MPAHPTTDNRNTLDSAMDALGVTLTITGRPLTPTQASRVLLATTHLPGLDSDDGYWSDVVGLVIGLDRHHDGTPRTYSVHRLRQRWNNLAPTLLTNDRILTREPHGLTGWCDWDGTLGACAHPLPPHPTPTTQIDHELATLAPALPFLSIHVQLAIGTRPVSQWHVHHGHARPTPVDPPLCPPCPPPPTTHHGVDLQRLRQAMQHVGDTPCA